MTNEIRALKTVSSQIKELIAALPLIATWLIALLAVKSPEWLMAAAFFAFGPFPATLLLPFRSLLGEGNRHRVGAFVSGMTALAMVFIQTAP